MNLKFRPYVSECLVLSAGFEPTTFAMANRDALGQLSYEGDVRCLTRDILGKTQVGVKRQFAKKLFLLICDLASII